jgi:heat shock protein 4
VSLHADERWGCVSQDWLYDEGEDATKAVYGSKMEEIRFIAGPIVQRYKDKLEAERQAALKAREEAEAAKRAAQEAAKQAEDASKRADDAAKTVTEMTADAGKEEQLKKTSNPDAAADAPATEDTDMKDAAETITPDSVEEPDTKA